MQGTIRQQKCWWMGSLCVACLLVAGMVGYWTIYRYLYPYGRKEGAVSLPGLYLSLLAYAGDHGGWFPYSDKGPYDALQKLYDSYCPSGKELAGVSGDSKAVATALRGGKSLDASVSSWVYIQGLRLGDPERLALVWESRPGLYWNGRRNSSGARAVLLINGDITNVAAADWIGFLMWQEQMRAEVLRSRQMEETNQVSSEQN